MAHLISADGISIAYQRDGDAPAVILIGGGLDDGSENAPLARELADNYPVLLIDGIFAGVWHQRRSSRQIEVAVEPLTRLIAAQRRALEHQVDRIGEIFEGEARLTVGTVTAGAHA